MKIAVFSTQPYDQRSFEEINDEFKCDIQYFHESLSKTTAVLASGSTAVCVFVNDEVSNEVIAELSRIGVKLIALRCAGFNNVDLEAAKKYKIAVVRVPAYSPFAVAEYTVGLLLTLDRRINRAWMRVRMDNFNLDGLLGRDLHSKKIGVIGTGRIGYLVAKAFKLGFGCNVVANDVVKNPKIQELDIPYVELDELYAESDVVCLHCPMTTQTHHMINEKTLKKFKKGATLINTSRGGLVEPKALVDAIESGSLGAVGMDVYEDEKDLFFRDLSNYIIRDDTFQRLITFPNVLITGHQAFFTKEALSAISKTTLQNVVDFEKKNLKPENTL